MSFIDIKDPKKRDRVVADYVAMIRRVQQRNEDEKSAGLAKQAELEHTFNPIVQAAEKTTRAITEHLDELKEKLHLEPLKAIRRRKRTWDDRTTGLTALGFYMNEFNKDEVDKYFGISKDDEGNLVLGDTRVLVDGNSNIIIGDRKYEGTPGLWSLIMQKSPTGYTDRDRETFKEVMAQTDLMNHPRNVKTGGRPYNTAKRRLMEQFVMPAGSGLAAVFLPGDIKGLTTKLNLLLAEFRAGNTSTRNEIVYILDELSRRKRISRKEYTEINNFLQ